LEIVDRPIKKVRFKEYIRKILKKLCLKNQVQNAHSFCLTIFILISNQTFVFCVFFFFGWSLNWFRVCKKMKNCTFFRKVINDCQSTYNCDYKKILLRHLQKKKQLFFSEKEKRNNTFRLYLLCGLLITINVHNSTRTT